MYIFPVSLRSQNIDTIERKLEKCIDKIKTWGIKNDFIFSKIKIKCVHFCNKSELHNNLRLKKDRNLNDRPVGVLGNDSRQKKKNNIHTTPQIPGNKP